MSPLPGVVRVQGDLTHPSTVRSILAVLAPQHSVGADVVLCDCAPDVIDQADVDEAVQHDLVRAALDVARSTLRADGSFVCKVFRGPRLPALLRRCQRSFRSVELAKPTASRNSSVEAFIVARQHTAASDATGRADDESGTSSEDSGSDSDGERPVPFVSCGDEWLLDADQTYPLSFRIPTAQYSAYQPLAPAAAPIEPPYQQSILRLRNKAASSLARYNERQ